MITIELGFNGQFDLSDQDADILVKVEDGDVMFQKERLLNCLIEQHLPDECDQVVWLDCDILFSREDWAEATSKLLRKKSIIQPFQAAFRLQSVTTPFNQLERSSISSVPSFAHRVRNNDFDEERIAPHHNSASYSRAGLAWAARRECLAGVGLFDRCIIGSGDAALTAVYRNQEEKFLSHTSSGAEYNESFRRWSHRIRQQWDSSLDFLPGTLTQLWHGDYADRRYSERHDFLRQHSKDAVEELQQGRDGAWRWTDSNSEIARYVSDYFWSRNEDGADIVSC